jgi:hypothetical protein
LWERLAMRVPSSGSAVVGLQPPSRPEWLERTEMTAVDVGRHRYVGLAEAEPTGPRTMRWTMTDRKTVGQAVLEEAVNTFDWWTIGVDDIREDVARVGLTADPADEGLVVIRRSAPRGSVR